MTSLRPLYCPRCGDRAFYTARPIETDVEGAEWVQTADGSIAIAWVSSTGDLAVVSEVTEHVFCHCCHSAVTGTSVTPTRGEPIHS